MRIIKYFTLPLLCNCFFRSTLRESGYRLFDNKKYYPFSQQYFEKQLKRLNSKNISLRDNSILHGNVENFPEFINRTYIDEKEDLQDEKEDLQEIFGFIPPIYDESYNRIFEGQKLRKNISIENRREIARKKNKYLFVMNQGSEEKNKKSENFYVVKNISTNFTCIGGYDMVKEELSQCLDILTEYEKYKRFNVRIPKGLILEGPPGNGKTLLAKGFAGEAKTSFIAVAGSEFQEKYVGIGSSRIKELFKLAKENKPCIIFIDEIDALGRKRSSDGETSGAERDNTLNQLLIQMDGFDNSDGVFIIGATNRVDLLDPALIRPGRIDKRIFISLPDSQTRKEILKIHIQGKPHDMTIILEDLVDLTTGMSAAQIENLLNEAMLYALRNHRFVFTMDDIDLVLNRVMAGWQPTKHQFTEDMIERITIHEMGHAIIGLLMKQHSRLTKIVINLSSPKTPGYTVFEGSTSNLYTRESLFEHLMVLLSGRIAEEVFYNVSVTTGAINDFEEALKLAEKMIVYYGMGEKLIYPSSSEKSKAEIDDQVQTLIHDAYSMSYVILANCKEIISQCSEILKRKKVLKREELFDLIWKISPEIMDLY